MSNPNGLLDPADNKPVTPLRHTRQIGLVLFEDCSLSSADLVAETFRRANVVRGDIGDQAAYRVIPLSQHGDNVVTSSSMRVWTERLDTYLPDDFDTLFVACNEDDTGQGRTAHVMSWLSTPFDQAHKNHGVHVASNSKARPPPVYWFGDLPSSSASPVPLEMALSVIEMDLGGGIARRVATEFTQAKADPQESGTGRLNVSTSTDKIRDAARWIRENFGGEVTIAGAAEVAAMSNRNFLRRFKAEFGVAPLEYLMRTRCELICRLLIETDLPVDKIARRCGMGNGDRMGRLFRRRFGASPTEYRARTRARLGDQAASEPAADYVYRGAHPR